MTYEYRCKQCGNVTENPHYMDIGQTLDLPCPVCSGRQVRIFSHARIKSSRDIPTHFNESLGRPISSQREFVSELHRKSDEMSERLGMDHKYEPLDWRDREAFGVTDEGTDEKLHEIAKRRGKEGKRIIA